jgi:beta-glucuronidase
MKSITTRALILVVAVGCSLPAFAKSRRPVSRSEIIPIPHPLKLAFPGKKGAIDYEKFGRFEGVGTKDYKYIIENKSGLGDAVGEGIFPNFQAAKDPRYKELLKAGKLQGKHWNFVDIRDAEVAYYKWATASEDQGVKQFYIAMMLERAGLIEEAIKAYYALAVHFPKSVSFTYYKTPWYVGPVALDRVVHLLRRHPKIPMHLEGGKITIEGRYDNDLKNDVFTIDPGRLLDGRAEEKIVDVSKLPVIKTVGGPTVQLRQYENKHWQLFVSSKPFMVHAITYAVVPVGLSPDRGTWNVAKDWQLLDTNNNGLHDGLFESFIDKNGNNVQDKNEPTIGDAKLLKDLGVNTLRVYHHTYNKELFRKLHKDYGFYILCGDLIGMYTVGSGAKWTEGTDYRNPEHQQNMLNSVRQMVEENKDEPYVLMWVLGNENVYGNQNSAGRDPDAFFEFVNKAAKLIHELDPSRPVAVSNGDFLYLDVLAKHAPEVDVIGANAYRGEQGFGRHFFSAVQDLTDKPVLVTEYGVSNYAEDGYTPAEIEAYQAMYLANNWEDFEANSAGRGVGNALGGVLFEYADEWWKANSDLPDYVQKERAEWYAKRSATYKDLQPNRHDIVPQFGFPFLDGWSYEEWLGIMGLGDGSSAPFVRVPRAAYFQMKKMWRQ